MSAPQTQGDEFMGTMSDPMLSEFREEVVTTKRALERIPKDKLTWKPHPKSMSLGELAWHVAVVPGNLAKITQPDSFDVAQAAFQPPQPKSLDEILAAYDESVKEAEQCLEGLTDQRARETWQLVNNDKKLVSRPRIEILRSIMLNHWYHHRGQLSVYLRMLDVPVPVTYGPSADENPFN
jgi:uncharacterized damage-inducible protein DinB